MKPAPGNSILTNLVSTLIQHGNNPTNLNLSLIARHQPMGITEGDLLAEFKRQQPDGLTLPETNAYDVEGK